MEEKNSEKKERKMRDSGIPWIGEVPEGWELVPLKYLLSNEVNSLKVGPFGSQLSGSDFTDDGYWVYNQRSVLDKNFDSNDTFISESKFNSMDSFKVEENDILITTRGTIGKICRIPQNYHKGIIHPCIIKFRINESLLMYSLLEKIFNESDLVKKQFEINSNATTIDVIYGSTLRNILIPVPPVSEQHRIADFLDSKYSEIDTLIENLRARMQSAKEYKKAVITEAVTKGLDKNIDLKETDSFFWHNIPKHWDFADIKYVFEIVKRIAGKEGYDVLSVTQKGLKVKDITCNEGQIAANYKGYQFVYPDDFVMNHMDLLTGWVDCSKMFGVTSPDYRVFRLQDKNKHDLRYYTYIMQCCYTNRYFYSLGQGVSTLGRWRLQTSSFMNFQIPVPPKEEQRRIADYLDSKCSEIDALLQNYEDQITTLEEYKKSLIYQA